MATQKRGMQKGLGRGLDALLGEYTSAPAEGVHDVDMSLIDINMDQPRKRFDDDKLEELRASIARHGVVQPIIVRRSGDRYLIVAGERRFRAAKLAGLSGIPAIIREFSDADIMEVALIENIQREDLNPIEIAEAVNFLIKQHDLTQEEVAERIGKSRTAVTNILRLLKLPPSVKDEVKRGSLQMGHARALAALDAGTAEKLAREAIAQDWSVREVERRASAAQSTVRTRARSKSQRPDALAQDADVQYVLNELRDKTGAKATLRGTLDRGALTLEYYSREHLEALIEALTGADR
ncbi:MAG: ParB/RepB/Spo0J family partition protein [Clostridia bacterium]|nr:ParB/RepB/Spo0J family partition protein [Clostridia bacterium]